MRPAIVIGTHTMRLGVIRALGMMGVPVIAIYYKRDEMGYVSKYVHERICFQHPETDEEIFLVRLMEMGIRYPNSPLFPASNESLKIISQNKSLLSQHYKVACTEWEIVRQILKKNFTYEAAASIGVPIPKTLTPDTLAEVFEFAKGLEFPCLVKPVESHRYYAKFLRKMVKVNNVLQLVSAYQEAEKAGLKVMLQELIPGDDLLGVNYNSYFRDGKPIVDFTAQKIRNAPLELGSPCALISRKISDVRESGRKILKALGFYGYSCIKFKRDPRDGVCKLLEVNGRHNLFTLLAVNCGINFPWLHYKHLMEGVFRSVGEFREGFFWVDTERDLVFLPQRIFSKKEAFLPMFLPYVKPHVQALFDIGDLKPFIKRYIDFAKAKASQIFHVSPKIGSILKRNRPCDYGLSMVRKRDRRCWENRGLLGFYIQNLVRLVIGRCLVVEVIGYYG